MWELDYKENWGPKNWCFWTVVLEKTLESPLDCKEIQPVHPKGDHSWVFNGGTDVEAETPILWPPDVKSWLIWKDPDAGKDWGQEKKGTTEDELVGWHHWLDGNGFGWTPGVGDGQGGLACCGPCGHRVGQDWTTEVNWRKLIAFQFSFVLFVRVGVQDLHVRMEIGRASTVPFVCFKVCVDALWLSRSQWSLPRSSILVNIPHPFESNVYSTVFEYSILYISRSIWLILFNSSMSLLFLHAYSW